MLRERRKNVHALLHGTLVDRLQVEDEAPVLPISYNPYVGPHFYCYADYKAGDRIIRPEPLAFVSAPWARLVVMDGKPQIRVYHAIFEQLLAAA